MAVHPVEQQGRIQSNDESFCDDKFHRKPSQCLHQLYRQLQHRLCDDQQRHCDDCSQPGCNLLLLVRGDLYIQQDQPDSEPRGFRQGTLRLVYGNRNLYIYGQLNQTTISVVTRSPSRRPFLFSSPKKSAYRATPSQPCNIPPFSLQANSLFQVSTRQQQDPTLS